MSCSLCILVTTVLQNAANVWLTGRGVGQPFTVHAVIGYPTQFGILYPLLSLVFLSSAIFYTAIIRFSDVYYAQTSFTLFSAELSILSDPCLTWN